MTGQRAIVVIGASGGIGSDLSRRLVKQGHRVTLTGRNEAALKALADELDAPFRTADATVCDDVAKCLEHASDQFGRVDGIVNCAGSILLKPAHLTTLDEWSETLALNLTTAFVTVKTAFPVMRKEGGSIVLFSSAAARTGVANHEAIAAAKAGVIGLMQSAATTYASRNIRINAVAPGLIQTPLTERVWSNEKGAAASRAMHPLGRLGKAGDAASLAAWLLAEENSWITGQTFGVDGGLATLRCQPK